MIEVTISAIDGVKFYKSIRFLEPDAFKYGIPVHFLQDKVRMEDPQIINMLKRLGLRKIYRDPSRRADVYTIYPVPYWRFKVIEFIFNLYWKGIYWLYYNGRLFQEIPHGSVFSWKYFTPYCWYRKIRKRW